MNRIPELRGEHLRLREMHAGDHDAFARILTHRVLTRYLGIDRMDTAQAHDAFTQCLAQPHTYPRRKYTLAICAPDDDTLVGTMGLLVEDYGSNAMLTALVLLPGAPVRGHGHEAGRLLMAYAFGHLGLHRIWAGHRSDHRHMTQIMHAAGLRPEATLRQLFRTQSCWHDVTTYAAVAPEWRNAKPPRPNWPSSTARPGPSNRPPGDCLPVTGPDPRRDRRPGGVRRPGRAEAG
ncbi:GNAT family N-acetyltransferase [Streptomyces griseorubiginosus]|uniref:GNAT family N-acetyltransferase n=1 Tax=Streptomyces griseorubiginosus TaxID=67304 RepID=UPI003654F767